MGKNGVGTILYLQIEWIALIARNPSGPLSPSLNLHDSNQENNLFQILLKKM